MAPYYFRYQRRHGYKEALRTFRFRCARGVKHLLSSLLKYARISNRRCHSNNFEW